MKRCPNSLEEGIVNGQNKKIEFTSVRLAKIKVEISAPGGRFKRMGILTHHRLKSECLHIFEVHADNIY